MTFYWNLWWIKKALIDLKTNPLFCNYIFYPAGAGLGLHTLNIFNGLISIPFQLISNLTIAYNIIVIFSFVLSAYGTYLLVNYLIKDKLAALIAGIIFSFCPYKFAHLFSHMNLISTEWIPFYILFLFKSMENMRLLKYSFIAGIFLALTALCDYYYFVFLLLFTLMYFAYISITSPEKITSHYFLKNVIILIFPVILVFIPIVYSIYPYFIYGDYVFKSYSVFVSDLLGPLLPNPLNPFIGHYFKSISSRLSGGIESIVSVGTIVLIIAVYGCIKLSSQQKSMKFWIYSAIVFYILSLGNTMHIIGKEYPIPLPYAVFQYLPVLKGMRVPSRMAIMEIFCIAIIFAYTFKYIFSNSNKRLLLGILFVSVISMEYFSAPYVTFSTSVPKIYETLSKEKDEYSILDIPLSLSSGNNTFGEVDTRYQFWQTVHNKKILNGVISRGGEIEASYILDMPFIKEIVNLQKGLDISKTTINKKDIIYFMNKTKPRYIVIHPPYINSDIREFIQESFKLGKVYEDKEIIAFKILNIPKRESESNYEWDRENSLHYAKGWYEEEKIGNNFKFHWSEGRKSLILVKLNKPVNFIVKIKATPYPFNSQNQTLIIYINNKYLSEQTLSGGWNEYSYVAPVNLWKEGINKIDFYYKYTLSPKKYSNSNDKRKLAIALNYIKLNLIH